MDAPTTCRQCGYDMTGLDGRACPECGEERPFAPEALRIDGGVRAAFIVVAVQALAATGISVTRAMCTRGGSLGGWTPSCLRGAMVEVAVGVGFFGVAMVLLGFLLGCWLFVTSRIRSGLLLLASTACLMLAILFLSGGAR